MLEPEIQVHPHPSEEAVLDSTESTLHSAIGALLCARHQVRSQARLTRDQLTKNRESLSEKLHELKAHLRGVGREGRWGPFLDTQNLARTTADRYVAIHDAKLHPEAAKAGEPKLPSGELPADETAVRKLAVKLLPQILRLVTTREAAINFLDELAQGLPGVEGGLTATGLELAWPEPCLTVS